MKNIVSCAVATGVVLLLPLEAQAKPPIIVTDSDCASFPDGVGSGVETGDTILLNTDLTVDSDGNDCILIASVDRVKLMLNGHTIDVGGGDHGIRIQNSKRIEIRGPGKIQDFGTALGIILGSLRNLATELIIAGNDTGVEINNSSHSRIENNIVFANDLWGFLLTDDARDNTIKSNEVFGNVGFSGIFLRNGAVNNVIENNNVSSNVTGGIIIDGTVGSGNVIQNNIILGNEGTDIGRLTGQATVVTVENNICEVGNPADLCPAAVPEFDIDHF